MSLESQVADMNKNLTDLIAYYTGQRAAIDLSVKNAIAAVPETTRTWWVDPVTGSDSNDGKTSATPFKSINKAMAATPNAGQCNVNLMNDYIIDANIPLTVNYLVIYGIYAVSSGVTPKLKFKYMATTDSSGAASTQLAGFIMYSQAANAELRNVDLDLPSPAGLNPQPVTTRICSPFKTNAGSLLPPVVGVTLQAVKVFKAADFVGAIVGQASTAVIFQAVNCTFPSDMAGKYISTVAAGTDLKILTNILTNLGTL
ncbi:hypothetical protein [Pseudomonas putida]|uniref:hypothetical protein n=1 Tax=Pseudomonas putida TaxID=303 RepID=UPI004046F5A7